MAKKKNNSLEAKEFIRLARSLSANLVSQQLNPVDLLAENSINSPLILLGSDPLRTGRLIEWMHTNFFGGDNKTLKTSYNAGELNNLSAIKAIASSFQSMSLFTTHKICVVNHIDSLRAAPAKELLKLFQATKQAAFIILCSEKPELKGPLAELSKTATVVTFSTLSESELQQWIKKEVSKLGFGPLDAQATKLLCLQYGDNLLELSHALERIALYFTAGEEVRAQQIHALINIHQEKTESELMSAISRKDMIQSITICKHLLEQGLHPLQINAILIRYFKTLLELKTSVEEVSQKWFIRRVQPFIQHYTMNEIIACLRNLAELDIQLKSSRMREDLLMEIYMRRLTMRGIPNYIQNAA